MMKPRSGKSTFLKIEININIHLIANAITNVTIISIISILVASTEFLDRSNHNLLLRLLLRKVKTAKRKISKN